MEIFANLNKNNLHHAYLIEGDREEIMPELFKFLESLGVKTSANPDFCHISVDSFKIEDARNLKSVEHEKSFSLGHSSLGNRPTGDATGEATGKKIFLISANNFLLEAQNTLLKIFEEPIENTHFFVIVPDKNTLLKTLVSRFYLIETKISPEQELKEAEKFIKMSLKDRIDFVKELLVEAEEKEEIIVIDSTRSKALKFLNVLESVLSSKFLKNYSANYFAHIFKVREFLNQPGSSAKTLMESVALIVPNF